MDNTETAPALDRCTEFTSDCKAFRMLMYQTWNGFGFFAEGSKKMTDGIVALQEWRESAEELVEIVQTAEDRVAAAEALARRYKEQLKDRDEVIEMLEGCIEAKDDEIGALNAQVLRCQSIFRMKELEEEVESIKRQMQTKKASGNGAKDSEELDLLM